MARANVYLPDELARECRAAGLVLSQLAQIAVRRELARAKTDLWLVRVGVQRGWAATHEEALGALRDVVVAGGGP